MLESDFSLGHNSSCRIPLVAETETSQMKQWKSRRVGTDNPDAVTVRITQLCGYAASISLDHNTLPLFL